MRTQNQRRRRDTVGGVAAPMWSVLNRSAQDAHQPTVQEIMAAYPTVVPANMPTGKVARLMVYRKIGCVVVYNNGSVEGIFTERDLLRRAVGSQGWDALPVSQFMTPKPATVGPDEPLTRVVELLYQGQVRHLPVVEGDRLLLYTDGVTECRNKQQGLFGQQRMVEMLSEHSTASSDVLVKNLDVALARFRDSDPPSDDLTCVAIEVKD